MLSTILDLKIAGGVFFGILGILLLLYLFGFMKPVTKPVAETPPASTSSTGTGAHA